ncbi:NUMOD3 domain-containing DNA-binding protein [Patescibacteria group bacterium AH-259-L07]|nr:NUMOD3 domain-containing DNA-binding protein [Patescibacteria group bacterium AH-259-L07]
MITLKCLQCNKDFQTYPCRIRIGKGKFCSKECSDKSTLFKKGDKGHLGYKHSEKSRNKMSESHIGMEFSENHKIKLSISKTDENHPLWKGDNVGYSALHHWINNKLGRPTKCEHCKTDGLTGRKIHWANKSHEYLRDLKDWIRLCKACHIRYDSID